MRKARFAAVLALLVLAAVRAGADERRDILRSDYERARSALIKSDADTRNENDPALGAALDRVWSIVANWTAAFLDEHPDATARQVARAVEALDPIPACAKTDERCFDDYHLSATAVRLKGSPARAFAIAANYPKGGAFFIVARDRDGHVRAIWNIRDLARRHLPLRDEIGNWAWTGSGWGDGPLRGTVAALPPPGSGKARFYIEAVAATAAGGTYRSQFSIWEWSGVEARPLFIESYQVSFDTGPVKVRDGIVSIPAKGSYKSFRTCGACAEPHVVRRLRIADDGVHDLGSHDEEPEMRCVDEVWDRLIHGQPAGALATRAVFVSFAPLVKEVRRDAGADLDGALGMLGLSRIVVEEERRFLVVESDGLDCRQLRFELGSRSPGGACLRSLHVRNRCETQTGSAMNR